MLEEMLLIAALASSPAESMVCNDQNYEMPPAIVKEIRAVIKERGEGVYEIREKTPTGYITSLFIVWYKLSFHLEGLFIEVSIEGVSELIPCNITFAEEIENETGARIFAWFDVQGKI